MSLSACCLRGGERRDRNDGTLASMLSGGRRKRKDTSATSVPSTRRPKRSRRRPSWSSTWRSVGTAPPLSRSTGRPASNRAQAVRAVMTHADEPLTVDPDGGRDQHFHRARRSDVREVLETLAALGQVTD